MVVVDGAHLPQYRGQVELKACLILTVVAIGIGVFAAPFAAPFLLLGILGASDSLIASRRQWLAYSRGTPVRGKIDRVQRIENAVTMSSGRHDAYRVFFRFRAGDKAVRGMIYSFDTNLANRYLGEPVWVVYFPSKPHVCAIWPSVT